MFKCKESILHRTLVVIRERLAAFYNMCVCSVERYIHKWAIYNFISDVCKCWPWFYLCDQDGVAIVSVWMS